MTGDKRERVGVVVVHGVGATDAGWIDGYVVPELQKWAAHASVDGLARKERSNDLVFVIPTADRPIAVPLGNDADFIACCKVAGIASLIEHADFDTRAERLARRDELNHYLGWTFSMHGAEAWLRDLRAANVPAELAFEPHSEVHRVRDPESSDPTRTWQSFSRRWRLESTDVIVTELFWADLSRVGTTQMSRASAFLQLLLESPSVLGRAFLNGSETGIHGLVRSLILASTWIMRWPIAGISVVVFAIAFAMILLQGSGHLAWLQQGVVATLATIVVGGVMAFRNAVHRKVGIADLALASALYAGLLLAGVLAAMALAPETVATPAQFLVAGTALALIAWTMWTVTIVAAIVLVCMLGLKQSIVGRKPDEPPAARQAAAIGLCVLLGIMWKFALTLFGVLMIATLIPGLTVAGHCPAGATLTVAAVESFEPNCMLAFVRVLLIDAGALNGAMIIAVLVVALGMLAIRSALKVIFAQRAKDGTLVLPRLIASPLILAVLFIGTLVNAWIFYIHGYENLEVGRIVRAWVSPEMLASGSIGLVVLIALLRRLIEQLDGVVHIGRDLVDHQYYGETSSLSHWLVPEKQRLLKPETAAKPYRRRMRIQRRLEALMENTIAGQRVDRLILVAHSQGTVIVHDYLANHDNLVPPAHDASTVLYDVKQIDVVTVGSPLTHIYKHYFRDYERPGEIDPKKPPLIARVNSWTNLWRVDDPIGQHVDIIDGVTNVGLAPGGHADYWREDALSAKLWALIHNLEDVQPAGGIKQARPWAT